ncbi:hypothetical protein AALP_AA4G151300 [Arabis alpina]|uniref:RNase H type-1 domain-containing protein n=1 Tax=Arabis alpina TaxID=50452 RepID=A0A087H3E1_ARAAL|nr:hypothetical protein AALP_AA4G151300 [Arabis alpina]
MGIYGMVTGKAGKSGFGSASTAEDVTHGIDANHLTAIITGGTSGIGLEAARVLAMRGAHVIIAARNTKAANESKEMIVQMNPNARVDFLQLDLSSTKSVRSFVHQFLALNLPLNILINNAGVMFCPFQLTEDGIESQFATNHIGHFLLTNLLLDKMKSTSKESRIEGRIVNLSSVAHTYTYSQGIKFDSINDPDGYSEKKAYGQSKLSNLLHSNALSRKLKEEGVNITVNSVHPGLVTTNLFRHSGLGMKVFKAMSFFLWKDITQGAATTCYVALNPNMKGVTGKYFADCNVTAPSKFGRRVLSPLDAELHSFLWAMSSLRLHGRYCSVFHTDSQELVNMVADPDSWPRFQSELAEFQELRTSFPDFTLTYCSRGKNEKADLLAKNARLHNSAFDYVSTSIPL